MPLFLYSYSDDITGELAVRETGENSLEEVSAEKQGCEKTVIDHMCFTSFTSDVIAKLMCVSYEMNDSFGRTLEEIMTEVFKRGVAYGRKHPK